MPGRIPETSPSGKTMDTPDKVVSIVFAPLLSVGEDGELIIEKRTTLAPEQTEALATNAAFQPYVPLRDENGDLQDPEDESLEGRPCIEVMLSRMMQNAARTGRVKDVLDVLERCGAFKKPASGGTPPPGVQINSFVQNVNASEKQFSTEKVVGGY